MATIEFDFVHGLKTIVDGKEVVRKHVVLGELTAGQQIKAAKEAELVVSGPDGTELVTSPLLLGLNILAQRVVSIGDITGPVPVSMLEGLHEVDMELLQEKEKELKRATDNVARELIARGRSDGDGS